MPVDIVTEPNKHRLFNTGRVRKTGAETKERWNEPPWILSLLMRSVSRDTHSDRFRNHLTALRLVAKCCGKHGADAK